jgi:hypothetical protein
VPQKAAVASAIPSNSAASTSSSSSSTASPRGASARAMSAGVTQSAVAGAGVIVAHACACVSHRGVIGPLMRSQRRVSRTETGVTVGTPSRRRHRKTRAESNADERAPYVCVLLLLLLVCACV